MSTDDLGIPAGVTSFCPPVTPLAGGSFHGRNLRHTIRPTGTADWLLIYTQRGSGHYCSGEARFDSRPHDITLFLPGVFQNYRASTSEGWDILFAHFLARPEWLEWMHWPERIPGTRLLTLADPGVRRSVVRRLHDAIQYSMGGQSARQRFGLNALEEVFLWCDSINPKNHSPAVDRRVEKAVAMLCTELDQPFSEERLAKGSGLSPSRLRHLFTAQLGESPRRFHERQKLMHARHLLTFSAQTISEIAEELGFQNPFYFSLRFKKETGMSPRSYRKRVLE